MIRVRKRQPKRKPGDLLPPGVTGRREVVHQLTGSPRFAPGVYHERRSRQDRRRPIWRQVASGQVRAVFRSAGRRQTDGYELPLSSGGLLTLGVAIGAVAAGWRRFFPDLG